MNSGYVKFWRKLQNSSLWLSEKFTRGQAWIDLIGLANYRDGFFRVRGSRIEVKRGQLGYSEVTLSNRWKWSRGKVRRFLTELESDMEQKIVQQKTNITTIISILNYDMYQANGTPDETANGHQTEQQTDSKQYTNNKSKKGKKNKELFILPDWMDVELWKDFKEHRNKLRKPMTRKAEEILLKKIKSLKEEGHNPKHLIITAIERGWQSVFAPK